MQEIAGPGSQVRCAFRVAAARGDLRRCRGSPMGAHRLRHGALHLGPRRSQRDHTRFLRQAPREHPAPRHRAELSLRVAKTPAMEFGLFFDSVICEVAQIERVARRGFDFGTTFASPGRELFGGGGSPSPRCVTVAGGLTPAAANVWDRSCCAFHRDNRRERARPIMRRRSPHGNRHRLVVTTPLVK